MNEIDYVPNDTGRLVWEPNGMYFRFEPNTLPFPFSPDLELQRQADATLIALARLDGVTRRFTDEEIRLYQLPFMLKEAQLSSEIEGTRSTITDVYKEEKLGEKDPERRLDNEEIRNYLAAMQQAIAARDDALTVDTIIDLHRTLLQGVRGTEKDPGSLKQRQNAIGKRDDTLDTAKFVPASPERTPSLMENLVEYATDARTRSLFRIGLTHYQFEAIHPFRDGNGRIGRLLIVYLLSRDGILQHPLLYVSEYLTRNRDRYIEALYNVSMKGDVHGWLLFLLKALEVQAVKADELLLKIDAYKEHLHRETIGLSKSPNMHSLIDSLFSQPFFTIQDVKSKLAVSQPGAWNLVQSLISQGIVREAGKRGRKHVYAAYKILDILEGRDG